MVPVEVYYVYNMLLEVWVVFACRKIAEGLGELLALKDGVFMTTSLITSPQNALKK